MRFTWSATGTPAEVSAAIGSAAKQARTRYPDAGPVISTAREHVDGALSHCVADALVTASVDVTIRVSACEAPTVADVVADVEDVPDIAPQPDITPIKRRVAWLG